MLRDSFFWILFFVLIGVAAIHIFGNMHFLYWRFLWLDIVAHVGGGFWVGGSAVWVYTRLFSEKTGILASFPLLVLSILSAFAVGMLWEIFEFFIWPAMLVAGDHFIDTIIDLSADVIGALFAALYFLRLRRTSGINQT